MKRRVILRLLLVLLAMVFAGALVQMISLVHTQKTEKEKLSRLQEFIRTPVPVTAEPKTTGVKQDTEKTKKRKPAKKKKSQKKTQTQQEIPSYDVLYEKNQDFIGWLTIEGTSINYPVMYTPDDEEYYLHRSFDKKYSYSGVPFLGRGSDLAGNNILVYGHHMRDGTMFADLTKYEKEEYRNKHSEILFDIGSERRTYEVIVAFPTTVASNETFRYYDYTGKLSKSQWKEYIMALRERDEQMPEKLKYGDNLITLSTCAYHEKEGRFVVVGRQVHK